MALDFPNSPAINDIFVSGSLKFRWDGTKWVAVSSSTAWLVGVGLTLDTATDPDTIKLQIPVAVSSGGTGATTQQGAQAALGGPFLPLIGGTLSANTGATPVIPVGTVLQVVGANATTARITIDGFAAPILLTMRYANGTMAAPSIVTNNNILGGIYLSGYGTSGYTANPVGTLSWSAAENWSATRAGTSFQISTVKNGTLTLAPALSIDGTGQVVLLGPLNVAFPDSTYQGLISGTTKGVRFVTNATETRIEGVDQTGTTSYQPLTLNGSTITLAQNTTVSGTLNVSNDFIGALSVYARDTIYARPVDTNSGYTVMIKGDSGNAGYFAAYRPNGAGRSFYLGYGNPDTDFHVESGNLNLTTPSDGFKYNVAGGSNARVYYTVNGARTWSLGTLSNGNFQLGDETAGVAQIVFQYGDHATVFYGPVVINSGATYALQVSNGSNVLKIHANNFVGDTGYPSIRANGGADLILSPSNNGTLYLGNDANYRNIQFKGNTYNGQGHYPSSNNVGSVGIGGQSWTAMSSYAYNNASGRNDKKEIQDAPHGALAKVKALRAVIFRWREHPIVNHFTHERSEEPGPIQNGFIADEVAKVFGEDWGGYQKVGEHESIQYNQLVSVLWQAVQELAFELEVVKSMVARGAR